MNISEILRQLNAFWQKLGGAQKVSVTMLTLILIIGFAGVSIWASRPSFSTLYSNISAEDASAVISKLDDAGVPYKLGNRGSTVMVPSAEVNAIRLRMAGEGLPKGNYTGFELFDKNIIGLTDFMQKVNYARALQGELARTISGIDEVSSCRVHIVIPEESIFEENQQDTTASIVVKLAPGCFLNKQQVGSIRYLVASAVAGLKPGNITIVDTNGTALSQASAADSISKLNDEQLEAQKSMDRYLETKVQSLLEGVLGHGNAVVKITSVLNFEKINKTVEQFDPDSAVVRRENIQSQKRKEGSSSGSGSPGAEPNVTAGGASGAGTVKNINDSQENIQNEYEIDRTVQHVVGEVGNIKRLSIAVYLARRVDPQSGEATARTDKEMTDIENMVKAAVGYRNDPLGGRVDDLVVKETAFDTSMAQQQDKVLAASQRNKLMLEIGRYLVMAVVAAGLLMLALNALKAITLPGGGSTAIAHHHAGGGMRKSSTADFNALENAVLKDLPELQEGEEGVKQLEQYLSLLAEDRTPDFINLVKNWIQNPNNT